MPIGTLRLALLGAVLFAVGCDTVPAEKFLQVQRESQAAKEQVQRLESQLADEQKTVRHLQEQLAVARGTSVDVLSELVAPVRIDLRSDSGGYDLDGKAGDDGIVLYVQPIDRDGDAIKATGAVRVTLLDLSDPGRPNVVSQYEFDVPTSRKMWYGKFLTYHYTIRCPWPPGGPPRTERITAVVEFTDLLSGRVLAAQRVFDVRHAPVLTATQPG